MISRFSLAAVACLLSAASIFADDWKTAKVPDVWKSPPDVVAKEGKGFVWFRCWVQIPATWKASELQLFMEAADEAREAYLNGVRIGGSGAFPPEFRSGLGEDEKFRVPAEAVRFGAANVVAIRIYQNEPRTGFNVAAPAIFGGAEATRLEGNWQFRAGDDSAWAGAKDVTQAPENLVFNTRQPADEIARTLKKLAGEEGPLSPADALKRFQVPDDLELELVLSEPEIAQPLFMNWDERGRLWVMQYLQYPNPAGLKMISRDKHLRTVYDKVPPPPPNHFRGADKITIHEDTDGDGRFDKHTTFVDGLNLATSFAQGRGGVWVLNPPYLLFYPDKNHDDVPDGDPEVHLQGFWLEDAHSICNNLCFGPDGWLYAAQGSTVSADVIRPGRDKQPVRSMGQLIWRYHPETRRFEIFAEGGGNAHGIELDAKGRLFSGHNGGDTRGFHYVQGGYLQKGFGKHGALSNPYSFGYFAQMQHHSVPRFTHTFVIYEADVLPPQYRGKLFGVEPLQGRVVLSDITPDRSSFKTKDLSHPLSTTDTWCRPVNIKVGPDGAVYVADFYEQRIDHASHYQGRVDKTNGRIYRLKAKGAAPVKPFDYGQRSSAELVGLLRHTNKWHRDIALRLLADRRDQAVIPLLTETLEKSSGQTALDAVWALHLCGGLDEVAALRSLDHEDPYVRLWTVRVLCDDKQVSPSVAKKIVDLAYREPNVEVRSQLASSARRLPAADSLPIVRNLLARGEDVGDIHIPLLLWWALEAKVDSDRDAVVALFRDAAVWDQPIVREHITQRLMKRFALAGTRKDLLTCAKLLELAPAAEQKKKLMAGFEESYQGRPLTNLPDELIAEMAKTGGLSLALRLRQKEAGAVDEALRLVDDDKTDAKQRLQVLEILGQMHSRPAVARLLKLIEREGPDALRNTALVALQSFDDAEIGVTIVRLHNQLPPDVRSAAQTLLASRKGWTQEFLRAVDAGQVPRDAVPLAVIRKILLHPDADVAAAVKKTWGEVQGNTSAEMRTQVDRLVDVIGKGSGNPYGGRQLYRASCGKCHLLFEDGGRIGPDLTSYKRDDLPRMLLNVVNPSAEIREGFENYLVVTNDGRQLNGFIADQDKQVVTLRGVDGQTLVIPRDEIDDMRAVNLSIMPEGLLQKLADQEVRDLFAYLRSTQPLP